MFHFHYLQKINIAHGTADKSTYPFSLSIFQHLNELQFSKQVTFFVGENGSGKSTLLEAIAEKSGFGPEGGSKNIHFKTSDESNYSPTQKFSDTITCSWSIKPKDGYFFRAESFYNLATKIDSIGMGVLAFYGNKSLHQQSHGESFLSLFENRLGEGGFFLLDEPESALSPERQLTFLAIMHELCKNKKTQFIIATHSPIILAYPQSTIYSFDKSTIEEINYKETNHYQVTKSFLDCPDRYLNILLKEL